MSFELCAAEAAMTTAPFPLPDNFSSSQCSNNHSLKIKKTQLSFHLNNISIIDHPCFKSQDNKNHRSASCPKETKPLTTNQTEIITSKTIPDGKKKDHASFNCSVILDQGLTTDIRNQLIAPRSSLSPRRRISCVVRDRFIPPRSYSGSTLTKYHIRRLPQELTAEEKLLRRHERSKDPFGRQRNRRNIPSMSLHSQDGTQGPHMSPHIVDHRLAPSRYLLSRHGAAAPRQVSVGAIWNVGGASLATRGPWLGIKNGQRGYSGSNATAPMYFANFEHRKDISTSEELEMTQTRLAAAFDIDLAHRQLLICKPATLTEDRLCQKSPQFDILHPLAWKDGAWKRAEALSDIRTRQNHKKQPFATGAAPFYMLPTPFLEDDFYRSVIAHCCVSGVLAFAMGRYIYLWSILKTKFVATFFLEQPNEDEVTALAFSSANGKNSILAIATTHGYLYLCETLKSRLWRPTCRLPNSIDCVAFKATTTWQTSAVAPSIKLSVEHLAIGDKGGVVWYYSLEVSQQESLSRMSLLATINAHYQRVCSICWSPDDRYLATSGDDNVCLLFDLDHILQKKVSSSNLRPPLRNQVVLGSQIRRSSILGPWLGRFLRHRSFVNGEYSLFRARSSIESLSDRSSISAESVSQVRSRTYQRIHDDTVNQLNNTRPMTLPRSQLRRRIVSIDYTSDRRYLEPAVRFSHGIHVHQFEHRSAIKAVAFAPWQPTLLATGGGMADRTVHFYHAPTGSCLAKIYMWGQITGLIWSKTRREIAVVLGFAEIEHPFRVVVFAWPSCEQIRAIPWNIGPDGQTFPHVTPLGRGLSAISIPNFRNPSYEADNFNPADECIAVSSSDFIRFYRIWGEPHKRFRGSIGVMTSSILESLDGIENPGKEIIR